MGLASFYKRLIRHFVKRAAPLTDLLKKDAFQWSEATQFSFDNLKDALSNAPVLVCPDFSRSFIIETDASGKGLGAVLRQEHGVIAFESRKFNAREMNYHVYDQEMLAILHAFAKWHHYLYGSKIKVKTDHRTLKYFLTQPNLSMKQKRWLAAVQSYDFDIEYRKGKENVVADALSRMWSCKLSAISTLHQEWILGIQEEYMQNSDAAPIFVELQSPSSQGHVRFQLRNGLLWCRDRIYLVPDSKYKLMVLQEMHSSSMSGHTGITKTYEMPCQQNKVDSRLLAGLLQSLPIPEGKWTHIAMDFITGLPSTDKGWDTIFVVVDRMTKHAHFIPTRTRYSASQVA